MNLKVFIIFATVFWVGGADGDSDSKSNESSGLCGKNEEFVACPTPCPRTCVNPNAPICLVKCVEGYFGCQCKDGFFVNHKGECVKLEDCQCGKNEEFVPCPTPCPRTCKDPDAPICLAMCIEGQFGCQCKVGYFVNQKGECVELEDCHSEECN